MTNQHDEWKQLQKPVQHILQSFRRHTVLPCRYCKQSKVNKDRHWQQCHVLSFCAFLWVKHDLASSGRHGSGRSGEAILPALGATIQASSRPESSGPSATPRVRELPKDRESRVRRGPRGRAERAKGRPREREQTREPPQPRASTQRQECGHTAMAPERV